MPGSARCVAPGIAYHVTQRGVNRQPGFHTEADRQHYLRLVAENKRTHLTDSPICRYNITKSILTLTF